jgi:hypothetical protein
MRLKVKENTARRAGFWAPLNSWCGVAFPSWACMPLAHARAGSSHARCPSPLPMHALLSISLPSRWRTFLEERGRRPVTQEVQVWFDEHAERTWGSQKPLWKEARIHAKCLRSTEQGERWSAGQGGHARARSQFADAWPAGDGSWRPVLRVPYVYLSWRASDPAGTLKARGGW